MKSIYLAALLSKLVAAQFDYPNLPTNWLYTTNPVTPLPNGTPWGTRTANNTDPSNAPNTGVKRVYDFTISKTTVSADGYTKEALLINNQFPGPMIEANWGDTIVVNVKNEMPDEGLSLHWHGLVQKGTQYMDGVPGITQCPIVPEGTFQYEFLADLYGTSWYHSHFSSQYADGIFGPMIIHGPPTVSYDIDIGPIMLNDYYHVPYYTLVEETLAIPGVLVHSDNNVINGRNPFDCANVVAGDTSKCVTNTDHTKFKFTAGKKHRLRLINSGAEGVQKFSLDGHNLTVIANDFVPIIPYETQVVTLGVGQRADIIVEGLTGATGSYWLRSSIPNGCSSPSALYDSADATAIVYYGTETTPATTAWPAWALHVNDADACANDDPNLSVPWYKIAAGAPATTEVITIGLGQNETGNTVWTMNNSSFRVDYNTPVLLLSNLGNNSYPDNPEWNVYNFGTSTSMRIVIENPTPVYHPMHLHGHNFWIQSVGTGAWDETITSDQTNPPRRDVMMLPAGGHLVLQFNADNPGAWPLHCHIAWHVSAGLYVTVLERPDLIAKQTFPSIMAQTCRDWAGYTNTTIVDQIDSGL